MDMPTVVKTSAVVNADGSVTFSGTVAPPANDTKWAMFLGFCAAICAEAPADGVAQVKAAASELGITLPF